jgi:hypothetical protein
MDTALRRFLGQATVHNSVDCEDIISLIHSRDRRSSVIIPSSVLLEQFMNSSWFSPPNLVYEIQYVLVSRIPKRCMYESGNPSTSLLNMPRRGNSWLDAERGVQGSRTRLQNRSSCVDTQSGVGETSRW